MLTTYKFSSSSRGSQLDFPDFTCFCREQVICEVPPGILSSCITVSLVFKISVRPPVQSNLLLPWHQTGSMDATTKLCCFYLHKNLVHTTQPNKLNSRKWKNKLCRCFLSPELLRDSRILSCVLTTFGFLVQ